MAATSGRLPQPTFEALMDEHGEAPMIEIPGGVRFGFWACPRPMTKSWGSGQVFQRIEETFGKPDAAFGVRDGIPPEAEGVKWIDRSTGYDWRSLPFPDAAFRLGYWDPPFDRLYKPEAQEVWRTCRRLAILHEFVYPTSWFKDAQREAMIAVTMGPLRAVRILQVFRRVHAPLGVEFA